MEKLLCFDKPKKIRSTEEHNEMHQSDSGIAGTYVPNMTNEDKEKWKAKHIKGDNERIEIRKTINGVNIVIIVYKRPNPVKWNGNNMENWHNRHQDMKMSMNGKLDMTFNDWYDLYEAVREAIEILL